MPGPGGTGQAPPLEPMQDATRPQAVAVVDPEACVACGACSEVCPTSAIAMLDVAQVAVSRCTGCGACVQACPNEAIHLESTASQEGTTP